MTIHEEAPFPGLCGGEGPPPKEPGNEAMHEDDIFCHAQSIVKCRFTKLAQSNSYLVPEIDLLIEYTKLPKLGGAPCTAVLLSPLPPGTFLIMIKPLLVIPKDTYHNFEVMKRSSLLTTPSLKHCCRASPTSNSLPYMSAQSMCR